MIDPRQDFLDTLNPDSSRVITSPSPVVLLCGGLVKVKERAEDPEPQISSLRHLITNAISCIECYRPEEITSWHEDGMFKNLVQYEMELAALCSCIVLIIESPGSIAELGAFSQQKDLQEKLMVVKSSEFTEPSFIELGILRFITDSTKSILSSPVVSFPWQIEPEFKIDDDTADDIVESVISAVASLPKSQTLSSDQPSHATTVIRELIGLFIALKKSEIAKYLDALCFEVSDNDLKRKLFLLESFQLIKPVKYSDSVYYICTNEEYNTLQLSTKKGKGRLEAATIKMDCQQYYEMNKDKHRLGAIREFKKVGG